MKKLTLFILSSIISISVTSCGIEVQITEENENNKIHFQSIKETNTSNSEKDSKIAKLAIEQMEKSYKEKSYNMSAIKIGESALQEIKKSNNHFAIKLGIESSAVFDSMKHSYKTIIIVLNHIILNVPDNTHKNCLLIKSIMDMTDSGKDTYAVGFLGLRIISKTTNDNDLALYIKKILDTSNSSYRSLYDGINNIIKKLY